MDKKEATVTIIGIIVVAILMFFAGKVHERIQWEQQDICTPNKQCKNAIAAQAHMRDYQLDVYEDSTVIYDRDRKVAVLKADSTQALDNVISEDNQ